MDTTMQPDVRDVKAWNEWRRDNPGVTPDLRGADLSGADLRGADLRGADLYGADLRGADLRGASGILVLGQDSRGFRWGVVLPADATGQPMIKAGCRWFTVEQARAHWRAAEYAEERGAQVAAESRARLALAETLIAIYAPSAKEE